MIASGAFLRTDSIPARQARFVSYASPVAISFPLLESSLKRNLPVVPFLTMNFAGTPPPDHDRGAGRRATAGESLRTRTAGGALGERADVRCLRALLPL